MFGQLIPQVFYDAIARFVPGSVLLGTCVLIWPGAFGALEAGPGRVSLPIGIAWIIATYVLALLLEGGWSLLLGKAKRLNERGISVARDHALKDFERFVPDFDGKSFEFPGVPMMYDGIRLRDPVVGANIVKLRAEVQLCRTLFLGWILILASIAVDVGGSWSRSDLWSVVIGLLVALSLAFLLSLERQKRAYWSLYNHWLLLVQPGTTLVARREANG